MSLSDLTLISAWKELDDFWAKNSDQMRKFRLKRNYQPKGSSHYHFGLHPEIIVDDDVLDSMTAPRIFCDYPVDSTKTHRSSEYRWFIETVRSMGGGVGYEIHIEREFQTLEEAVVFLIGSLHGALGVLSLSEDIK